MAKAGRRGSRPPELPVYRSEENRTRLLGIYDDKMRSWPVQAEPLKVPTRYGTTHVIASGDRDAPVAILLHPAGVASFVWAALAAALSRDRRIYAVDTIGDLGRSELADPARYPTTGRDYSTWLDDIHVQLGAASADIVAASMGGWIALWHAIEAPQRVRRLVLLGPMGLPSWPSTLAIAWPITSLALRPTDAKRDALIRRAIGDGERAEHEMLSWMRIAGRCRPRMGVPLPVPTRQLRTIKQPSLVFLGGRDGAIGSAEAIRRRAMTSIPRCEVVVLPEAGHLMMIDEPDRVGAAISAFLTSAR